MISGQNSIEASHLRPYLLGCGYRASQLAVDVETAKGHRIPLAAFAHSPHDSRSACIAVIDGVPDSETAVAACRNMGAPLVFSYVPGQWQWWRQGPTKPQFLRYIAPSELPKFFDEQREKLSPTAIYRAKTWARFDKNYQLDFIDVGLMPLIEEEAGRKLADLIERCVTDNKLRLHWEEISQEQGHWLLQSNFWLLAAKILKDKGVASFATLELDHVQEVLDHVARHYGATVSVQVGVKPQAEALKESAREISRFSHLGLVSADALAYLYENALITKEVRDALGTYSTPTYLVDYIVGKLRPWIADIPVAQRQAFEPACGHAPFLLAVMQLLSDLLPESSSSPSKRHPYLRARLHGCDIDPFALEIARLRLTLADVPNPNGWDVHPADIFEGDFLARSSHAANIILANPTFANFSAERSQTKSDSVRTVHVNKAAEVLHRIVTNLQAGSVFGVILPQGLLYSRNAEPLRQFLATNFELSEICLLPDKVFTSDAESVVILGRRLQPRQQNQSSILYRRVRESGMEAFKRSYETTFDSRIQTSRFSSSDKWSFYIPDLEDVWEFCQALPKFGSVADIGRGFEFRSRSSLLFPKGAITESDTPRNGLVEGFARLREALQTHELPDVAWFNLNPSVIGRPRHGTVTRIPQVLLNYAPVSRGPWRLKAFLDKEGHSVASRFLVIRPQDNRWPLEALWGICNSPFANAYSYAFSSKRDVLAGLMRKMPIPDINSVDVIPLVNAVKVYLESAHALEDRGFSSDALTKLKVLHWRIDAEVISLYGLPPHLERQLLDLFSGVERRGVPFEQKEYFPKGFTELSTLRELLTITADWEQTNERRVHLIQKKVKRNILTDEKTELAHLQQLTDARIHLLAPLPIKRLEEMRDDLKRRGIWEGE